MVSFKVSPRQNARDKNSRLGKFAKVTKFMSQINLLPVSMKDDFTEVKFSYKVGA